MGDKYFILDLSSKKFNGDILDISYEGNTAISELVDDGYTKDFYSLNKAENNLGKFDNIIFFLSINKKYRDSAKKIFKSVKSNLRPNGRIIIWDLNYKKIKLTEKVKIKIINKNNRIKTLKDDFRFNLFGLDCSQMVKLLEKEGFQVEKKNEEKIVYYIEAKLMEEINENTISST